MYSEVQAADMVVSIIGQSTAQAIRITGAAAESIAKMLYRLGIYLYCQRVGGRPKDIANNPNGMNMVTIPQKDLAKLREMARDYGLKFFAVSERTPSENPIVDICIKMEDTTVLHRILERCEIGVIKETAAAALDQETSEKIDVMRGKTFEEAAEKMKEYSQDLEGSLNRNTDKNFARDTPYYVVERMNPKNYIRILPQEDVFHGQRYTKSTYSVYADGRFVEAFDDGRFEGRAYKYWPSVKEAIKNAGGFSDDLVYLGRQEVFDAYSTLYENGKMKADLQDKIVDVSLEDIQNAVAEFTEQYSVREENEIPPQQEHRHLASKDGSQAAKGGKQVSDSDPQSVKGWVLENEKRIKQARRITTGKKLPKGRK